MAREISEHLKQQLKNLPDKPGVYIHRDRMGEIIYVGKAISLKNRVRQYFQSSRNMDPKVRAMVSHIADFEYIVCGSEMEAFILENNLIKENRPKYNILLRDDKTYPYVKVTLDEEWPRIIKTRIVGKDRGKYYGPYSDVTAVNNMIRILNDVFKLKRCSAQAFRAGHRPCLNYHIGNCEGICLGKADRQAYMARVDAAMAFLNGKDKSIEHYLKEKMDEAAERMDYEEAARYRDYWQSARALMEGQRVVFRQNVDLDAVLTVGPEHMAIFYVRDGKLSGREVFEIQAAPEDTDAVRTGEFIKQYYGDMTAGPGEILVADMPEDGELIGSYLSDLWGKKVELIKPQRGSKRALLAMATGNRDDMLRNMEGRDERNKKREDDLAERLEALFDRMGKDPAAGGDGTLHPAGRPPYRVEAYDISNTNGVDTVAAMVVFRGLKKDKKAYRRFKVRTNLPGDDYGSMQEVLYRRFKRAQAGDPGFVTLPDLVVIDGGRGHLGAALQIMEVMGIDIPAVGAVKDDHHRTRGLVYIPRENLPDAAEEGGADAESRAALMVELELPSDRLLFSYIGTMQEEVHRFAIEYHRKMRDKKSLTSVLDEIPGIGPKKRNALLEAFGSIEKVREAAADELTKVPGITTANAEAIRAYFDQARTGSGQNDGPAGQNDESGGTPADTPTAIPESGDAQEGQ